MCCSRPSRSARLSRTGAWPARPAWPRVSRQLAPVSASRIPTSAAVWLIWKSLGPPPRSCPCGASSAVRRSGPPSDWPADRASSSSEPAPAKASAPRREIVGAAGAGLTRSAGVRRFRLRPGGVDAQLPDQAAGPQRPDHGPALEAHVDHEAGHEDPRAVEVQRVEGAGELVPLLDVEDPGDELEARAADEQQQRQPFQRVRRAAQRRPLEQLRQHRPQLGQQDRDEHQPQGDVQALVEPVQPDRVGGPGEQVEPEQPLAVGRVVDPVEVGVVGRVGQQAGDEHHRDAGQQDQAEDRGQPRAPDRAPPERTTERAGHLAPVPARVRSFSPSVTLHLLICWDATAGHRRASAEPLSVRTAAAHDAPSGSHT